MEKVLKPNYYDEFKCIANDCEDHCCAGWGVSIDKGTFNKYRKLNNKFGIQLNTNINRNRKDVSDGNYAKIKLDKNNSCPMLDEKGLCNIHKNLGAGYLSHTCKTYPRMTSKYNDLFELSLTISCPEVARKIILNKEPISFNYNEEELNLTERKYFKQNINGDKELYNLIWELRSVCISIIQYREIEVWKRMIFVAMMCEKIQFKLDNNLIEECYEVIEEYKSQVLNKDIVKALDNINKITQIRMPLAKSILQSRTKLGVPNKTFNDLCIAFDKVMDTKIEDSIEVVTEKYAEIENEYYSKFIKNNEYIIENYLVYYIFSNFMKAIDSKDIYKEVVKLVINYSMIRMLLTGKLAYHKEEFTDQNLIEVFYSFSRTVEHNKNFLEDTYVEMKELGYDKLAYLVILIK